MTTKKWVSVVIATVLVLGSLALIKVFPFWVTLACLVCLVGGVASGYLYKDKVEEVIELVNPSEVISGIKEWFAGLTANEASKAVSQAKKVVKKAKAK